MKKAILPALTLAAAVALPQAAEAIKLYFSQTHTSGSQTGHLMQDNCGGCPKGDKLDTLPTGLGFVLKVADQQPMRVLTSEDVWADTT